MATPDRVDVVVSETLGNYPFEENIVETLNDARARFLNPGGIIIPRAVEQFVCPVTAERFYPELSAWDDVGYGLDFAPAKTMTLNNIYVRLFEPDDLLGNGAAAQSWDKLAFDRRNKTTRSGEASWPIKKRTTVYGLALVVVGRAGRRRVAVNRAARPAQRTGSSSICPVLAPITVEPGQTLAARLRSTTSYEHGTNVTWTLAVSDASGREVLRQSLDLEKGFLAVRCPSQSWMRRTASISTLMLPGSEPMPTAERAWRPRSPSTATNRSEQPLITLG